MYKYPYSIDIPVLLIFFTRFDVFEKVFNAVRLARPSKLYLYQDGPRGERDLIGINKCREILNAIDWECDIHTYFQPQNIGCDPSEYIAQKWMFSTEEMGIVLEDDDVPSQSFFPFCKELLEYYKDNDKINIICGMNNIGVLNSISDTYFFSTRGSIWGWATWKRVIDSWDGNYDWLDDADKVEKIRSRIKEIWHINPNNYINTVRRHKKSGRAHYESILSASALLNSRINIVPKYNQISNIGIATENTHGVSDLRMISKQVRKLFNMRTYEIDFPIIHPIAIKDNTDFLIEYNKLMAINKPLILLYRRLASVCLRLYYGDFKSVFRGISRLLLRQRD